VQIPAWVSEVIPTAAAANSGDFANGVKVAILFVEPLEAASPKRHSYVSDPLAPATTGAKLTVSGAGPDSGVAVIEHRSESGGSVLTVRSSMNAPVVVVVDASDLNWKITFAHGWAVRSPM
jgi:hypothetical protein